MVQLGPEDSDVATPTVRLACGINTPLFLQGGGPGRVFMGGCTFSFERDISFFSYVYFTHFFVELLIWSYKCVILVIFLNDKLMTSERSRRFWQVALSEEYILLRPRV